jgi:protein-S-isoprenylcysteine O-methyltransferase Ste14
MFFLKDWKFWGRWELVAINVFLFALFFITGIIPIKKREQKRSAGMFLSFILALYAEMYGFPLTIYIITSLFGRRGLPWTYRKGHLLGLTGCYIGDIMIMIGVGLIVAGWRKIYRAENEMVATGIYKFIRHPQYTGIFLITTGLLIQWATIISFLMWPFLVILYYRLALSEEKEMKEKFKERYEEYARQVPKFFPSLNMKIKKEGV